MTQEFARRLAPRAVCSFGLMWAGILAGFACTSRLSSPDSTAVGERKSAQKCSNSLTTDALVFNALFTNRQARLDLISNKLSTDSFALIPSLKSSVADPNVPKVLKYLVRCALAVGQAPVTVTAPAPCASTTHTLRPSLGLCPQWALGPADPPCLERVSACVLALNNAEGKRVNLSMVGDPDDPLGLRLRPQVLTDRYQHLRPTPINSFTDCPVADDSELRNCGFSPSFVGTCTPGQWVSVAAGAPAIDSDGNCFGGPLGSVSMGQPMVMRACSGIEGCDSSDPTHLASAKNNVCSGFPDGPSLGFACPPAPNPENPFVAYFSVMVGPRTSGDGGSATPDAISGAPYSFRAAEQEVFSFSEGAFFGDFLSGSLPVDLRDVRQIPGTCNIDGREQQFRVIFEEMFACPDVNWNQPMAYALHRLCAVPGANCAATPTPFPCFNPLDPASSTCDGVDPSGAFKGCRDGQGRRFFAVTTHLNGPCDELHSRDREFCQRHDQPCHEGAKTANSRASRSFDPPLMTGADLDLLDGPDESCTDEN